jgi:hypothetical protein
MANYYYNGVKLPEIPKMDSDVYSYALLIRYTENIPYQVAWCEARPYVNSDNELVLTEKLEQSVLLRKYTRLAHYNYYNIESDTEGVEDTIGWDAAPTVDSGVSQKTIDPSLVFWTNTDILNADGSVYLAASDPVPEPTPQDFYIVKNGVGQKQDVYLRVGGQSVKLDEYLT